MPLLEVGSPFVFDSVLLVGGKYDLQNTTIAKITDTGGSVKLEEKNHYSLFVAPGIMLNDKVLGYAKLSYESSKASTNVTTTVETPTVTGIGYGVGFRTHLSGNWFANIEAARVVYSNKTIGDGTLSTGTTIGMFGLSYKF